jgi:hypothetical protein
MGLSIGFRRFLRVILSRSIRPTDRNDTQLVSSPKIRSILRDAGKTRTTSNPYFPFPQVALAAAQSFDTVAVPDVNSAIDC